MNLERALLVRTPWVERILSGAKTWEIRGRATAVRGQIGLIRSGSGLIVGTCRVADVVGPLTLADLRRNVARHGIPRSHLSELPYARPYAWVLDDAQPFVRPVPYRHPPGAIVWVRLAGAKHA